jgi:hypothetical protein
VVSVGTGYLDYDLKAQAEAEESAKDGWFKKSWKKTKNYFGSWKDYLLEVAQVSDTAGDKSGAASWLSGQIVAKLIFDV